MANYAIRVELKGDPSYEEYEKLHKLMGKLGFSRTVQGATAICDLPHATYYGESLLSVTDVRDSVRDKVKATIQNKILVFVIKAETWALGW